MKFDGFYYNIMISMYVDRRENFNGFFLIEFFVFL